MLLIKLSAPDLRLIENARSPQEISGALDMVKDRIEGSKVLKSFGKAPTVRARYGWAEAWKVAVEVLGADGVTKPPYPDAAWFARITGVLRNFGLEDNDVRGIAEHCRDNLRKPVSFDFMICQHQRIMNGEFDGQLRKSSTAPGAHSPAPDLTLHKLPEE